jgi:cell wall-associated NlpC family hydrolase
MFPADQAGRALARFLSRPRPRPLQVATSSPELLRATLRPGDVLLIDGDTRISVAIKYLTQSSWSHATLFIGDALGPAPAGADPHVLIEADVTEGVRAVPLGMYASMHTRICRPVGVSAEEIREVIDYAVSRLGHQYDMRHIWDLARYLLPTPPVPTRWRRRLLAIAAGDPTRAICSTLIAEAYQEIGYPILPRSVLARNSDPEASDNVSELEHIRQFGLYMPRDFDVSPYFEIVKPTLAQGFTLHPGKVTHARIAS